MRSGADPLAWFYARVVSGPEGCHVWTGRKNDGGYGVLRISERPEKSEKAHRWLYAQLRGPVASDKDLDHLCRNRACVNPDHLEPIPHAENCRRGSLAKLNQSIADEIRARHAAGERQADLAREFGVKAAAVGKIVRGERWAVAQSDR